MLVADDAEIVVNGSDSNKMAVCIKFNIKLNGCFFFSASLLYLRWNSHKTLDKCDDK